MKKNYLISLLALVLCFVAQFGFSQNSLADNEHGTLIQNWLNSKKTNYGLTDNDISDLQVSNAYYSQKTRINHVYVNQAYQGIKIHNAISSVAVRDNSLFHYANALIPNIASRVNATTPSIDASNAINNAVAAFDLGATSNLEMIDSGANNTYTFTNGGVSKIEIPVQLVYQPTTDGSLKLAWDLSIHTLDGKKWYSVRIDAISGTVLETNDWILTCNFGDGHTDHSSHSRRTKEDSFSLLKTNNSLMVDGSQYNVFPIPAESPNHGSIALVSEPADATGSPFGWHDTNGATGAEFTITRGNNVWAQEDADGNDGTGFAPDGGAALDFNFPYDENVQPSGYQSMAITNLFYMNNIMHDVWYRYGFDEASGNFQQNNYGNGGAGNDFVFADAQDGSGINNATFGTPADGGSPGMTMFLWSAPPTPMVVNNGALAGDYTVTNANFGADINAPITSDLTLVIDDNQGLPASTDPNDACSTITNGAAISGKIAILRRGVCEFGAKVLAAENEGAIAVVVVNNAAGAPIVMGPGADGASVTIPSVMVGQTDGEAMITALNNGETVNVTLSQGLQLDGDLDNGIVAHEYGHGISNRLIGGPSNVSCLGNAEQMGEGWSDWVGLMVTIKASDLPETGRGIGTFALGQEITGAGIRPFPYSTDTTINPVTYGDTNDTNGFSQPHGIGSIWAAMLWDLTWKYVEKYGFDPDYYNGTGGNNKVMQLVMDGLKLQACGSGFVGGRDSLLAADNALTGGEDQCLIWEVFAARGLGVNASEGTAFSRTDQVEDFTELPDTDPSLANCTSLSVDEFALASLYTIFPNPANDVLSIKVKKNFGKVALTLTDINGRQVISTKANLLDQVDLNIGALQSGMYILNIKGESIDVNEKIIKN